MTRFCLIYFQGFPDWVVWVWTVATVINAVGYGWLFWQLLVAWWKHG